MQSLDRLDFLIISLENISYMCLLALWKGIIHAECEDLCFLET